jgi:cytochrome c556
MAAAFASSGSASGAGEARAPATFMYILMVDVIGPAANSLWAAAAAPTLSEQDWVRVKQMTARLAESAQSVSFGGTTAADIERAKSSAWKSWAAKFTDKVSLAAAAAERKDKIAFTAAADDLLEVCEGCHVAFPQTIR